MQHKNATYLKTIWKPFAPSSLTSDKGETHQGFELYIYTADMARKSIPGHLLKPHPPNLTNSQALG